MHLFYYGIACAGVLGTISLWVVYRFYQKRVREVVPCSISKGKGSKFGQALSRRVKELVWYASALSFIVMALDLFQAYRQGTWSMANPWSKTTTILIGLGVPTILLNIRRAISLSYQERLLQDTLLRYLTTSPKQEQLQAEIGKQELDKMGAVHVERTKGEPAKVVAMGAGTAKPAKAKPTRRKPVPSDHVIEEITKGIQESAATDNKYSHLLSKEEADIVRDVIKEFLT